VGVLSACVLFISGGDSFAQEIDSAHQLPPILITGGEAPRHKKPPAPLRSSRPLAATSHAQPAAAVESEARSVGSGAKGPKLKATGRQTLGQTLITSAGILECFYRKQLRVFADARTFRSSIESASSCAPLPGARVCKESLYPREELPPGS
jgi:hypothetical protein